MTLIASGSSPSPVLDVQEKKFKPESPPAGELDKSRFKESLDKAIAKDREIPEGSVKTPGKNGDGAEVQKQAGDSVKKFIEGTKKTLSDNKKINIDKPVKLTQLKGKSDGEELNTNPQIKTEEAKSDLTKVITGPTLVKKTVGKSRSIVKDALIPGGKENTSPEEKQPGAKIPLKTQKEAGISEKSVAKEKTGNEALLIPFPGNRVSDAVKANPQIHNHGNVKPHPGKLEKGNLKKGKEDSTLTVIDTRNNRNQSVKSHFVDKVASVTENLDQTNKESNQIILGEQNVEKAASDDAKTFENRFNQNKEVLLARELKASGNEQIVKKATFILKDNNQGEIKLILKPESLGRVKIHLNMNENNLVGKIIVENSRVGQIFENNLNDLSRSFEEAGISSSSIEVSVGDGSEQNPDQDKNYKNDQPFFSDRLKTLDDAVPGTGRYGSGSDQQLINLVV